MSKVIRNEFIYSDEFDFDRFESTRGFLAEQDAEELGIPFEDALAEVDDSRVWDQIEFENAALWNDAKQRLDELFGGRAFVAIGNTGLWNGDCGAGTFWNEGLEKFFCRIFKDAHNITLEIKGGVLHIKVIHHDGTNLWQVKPLKERGCNAFWGWENRDAAYGIFAGLDDKEMHQKLFDKPYYSAKIKEVA